MRSQSNLRTIRIAARNSGRSPLLVNYSLDENPIVGEVRVKVKLTNAGDEILVRRGLLTADKVRSYEADALVDTGAIRSVLPPHVVQQLGLATVGKARATYANDSTDDVDVTEVVGIGLMGRRTTEETLVLGSEVLIGQTVLESLDLQVDCANHRVIPNPAHPDQPIVKIKGILDTTGISRMAVNFLRIDMFRKISLLVIIAALAVLPTTSYAQGTKENQVAITFDDLPVVSTLKTDEDWAEITKKLLGTMKRNKLPVVGFVNENKLYSNDKLNPKRVALLKAWLDAGLELGNHTFSHTSLNSTPLAEFQSDVLRGEKVLRELTKAKGAKLRYFRHPFLHTGRSLETRKEFESFLNTHGYTVAPVTIDNSEWIFAVAYDKARDANDPAAMARVAEAYIPYMESYFAHFENLSDKLFDRQIKQVLLLHANSINADHFEKLVAMMKKRGYKFITLEEALTDSAYRSSDTTTGAYGISWIDRWALTRNVPDGVFKGEPRTPEFVLKLAGVERG